VVQRTDERPVAVASPDLARKAPLKGVVWRAPRIKPRVRNDRRALVHRTSGFRRRYSPASASKRPRRAGRTRGIAKNDRHREAGEGERFSGRAGQEGQTRARRRCQIASVGTRQGRGTGDCWAPSRDWRGDLLHRPGCGWMFSILFPLAVEIVDEACGPPSAIPPASCVSVWPNKLRDDDRERIDNGIETATIHVLPPAGEKNRINQPRQGRGDRRLHQQRAVFATPWTKTDGRTCSSGRPEMIAASSAFGSSTISLLDERSRVDAPAVLQGRSGGASNGGRSRGRCGWSALRSRRGTWAHPPGRMVAPPGGACLTGKLVGDASTELGGAFEADIVFAVSQLHSCRRAR